VHVEVLLQLVERDAGGAGEQVADRVDAGVEALGVGVDLDPVAGRDDDRPRRPDRRRAGR
jgi:hypothetical protein